MPERFSRRCPDHQAEIVFRRLRSHRHGGAMVDMPWCQAGNHACELWLVLGPDGRVWAEATLRTYTPHFDVDQILEQWLAGGADRRVAWSIQHDAVSA